MSRDNVINRPGLSSEANKTRVPLGEIWRFFNVREFSLSEEKLNALKENPVFHRWAEGEWLRASESRQISYAGLPKVADDGGAQITRRIFSDLGEIRITFGEVMDPATIALIPKQSALLLNDAYLIIHRDSDGMFGKVLLPTPNNNCYLFYLDNTSATLELICDRQSTLHLMQ
jgi:hypothetical protein